MRGDIKTLFIAASILIGTVVGAGFLGIPSVVAKSGFAVGLFYLVFIFLIILAVNLSLGEIILRTKGHHQLTGYALRYLGGNGKKIMLFSILFGIYTALVAYLIGIGNSLNFILSGNLDYTFVFSIFVWVIMSFIVSFKISYIRKRIGLGTFIALFLIILAILIKFPQIDYGNFSGIYPENLFLPFGVVLFSFLGFSAMPEIEEYLHGKEKMMKKVLVLGTAIPFLIYFIFTFWMIGIYGVNIPEISTFARGKLVVFLGIATMSTAYVALSNALKDLYVMDYNFSRKKAWLIVVIAPIILFLTANFFNFNSFIKIISLGGIISGGINAILILLMIGRAKRFGNRKPEYSFKLSKFILFFIGIIFALGIIYEVLLMLGVV